MLAFSDTACGWTKRLPKHKVTWWWNEDVDIAVKEKRRFWKSWKQGGSKEYLEAKKTAKRAFYDAKRASELERFENVLKREDDRAQVFKISKQVTTTNQEMVGDRRVRNDRGDLATSDHEKHLEMLRRALLETLLALET